MTMSRRTFLGASAGAVVAAGTMARSTVFGANDRIGVCCIGFHGQGQTHIKNFAQRPDSEVVALCDVDRNVLEAGADRLEQETGKRPKTYTDMRDAFADDAVNAVSIATPNHWHALAATWACMAGKDVYVEKPFAHSFWEGQQLVKAARKYNRIVQHGTQSRSNGSYIRDMKLIREGFIGPIVHARGYVYKNGNRYAIGHGTPAEPPEHIDYNLWQGPAPERPYMVKEDGSGLFIHYNWHWFWDYGNGESGNQGVHEMDIAVWGMDNGLPSRVYSTGGRYGWDDDAETPNTQTIAFTYPDGRILTFEVRNLGSFPEGGEDACSNSLFGTEGYWVRNKGFFDYKNQPIVVEEPDAASDGPYGNFLNAVRSRKWEDVPGNPDQAFLSCAHIHLGNIAYRLGRSLEFDPQAARFKDDEANGMLKVNYREGFAVPEIT